MIFSTNDEVDDLALVASEILLNGVGEKVIVKIIIPKYGMIKVDNNGKVDFASPIPAPFNYGRMINSDENETKKVSAIVLGATLECGIEVEVIPIGIVSFTHCGVASDKLICIPHSEYYITDYGKKAIDSFFWAYVPARRALDFFKGNGISTRYNGIMWK